MKVSMPGTVDDMVANLADTRADLSWWDGGRHMPLEVAAGRMGVDPSTLEAWEGYRVVPSLPHLVVWQAVCGWRPTMIDVRGWRWDRGFTPFGPLEWGVPQRLEAFTAREIGRLTAALVRAMRALGLPIVQLKDLANGGNAPGVGPCPSRFCIPLGRLVDMTDAAGLCLSMDPVDRLPSESPDEDPAALFPEQDLTA